MTLTHPLTNHPPRPPIMPPSLCGRLLVVAVFTLGWAAHHAAASQTDYDNDGIPNGWVTVGSSSVQAPHWSCDSCRIDARPNFGLKQSMTLFNIAV